MHNSKFIYTFAPDINNKIILNPFNFLNHGLFFQNSNAY